ncbi:hypothetical protein Igag_0733 [Ignisphaera aggregans DSM 17230]|uniref:Uncharacterized protein n=1 Tax=Ignisphaera aggregans (strain DSM 17230 / JCM 13409 / AQ1.S1) TaxID=583356 RepID=E0ST86_IGNAA|nr:hypothetical protein Igag_0733 [Ignisphaera aggregans DSM 17230]
MSITTAIEQLFEMGYKPSDIVKMGYAKSTVYTIYKRWLKKRVGENAIYIAYDIDYSILDRFVHQLRLLGYNVIVGDSHLDTLELIDLSTIVVAIIGRISGYRRQLLYDELREANSHQKPIIALIEEGASVPTDILKNSIVIYFSRDDIPKTLNNIVRIFKNKSQEPLAPILTAIVIGMLTAFGIVAIMEILRLLLESRK